jgi:DNA repair protein RecO (recombination protein O)
MATEKAVALVVRGTDWSETSRITTLFTREFGKIRALAKGGRRLKSSFDVAFDLLTVCRIVFIRKSSGGLDLLTEAQLVERFPIFRHDLKALYAGYYIAELLAEGTQEYDPHPDLFDAAVATLRSLEREATALDAVHAFELAWLRELGYSPRLDACTVCETAVPRPGDRGVLFSPSAGGVLCPACGPAAADRRPLSIAALAALRSLTADAEPVPDLAPVRGELRLLLSQIVCYVLGRRPRLLSYVEGR